MQQWSGWQFSLQPARPGIVGTVMSKDFMDLINEMFGQFEIPVVRGKK